MMDKAFMEKLNQARFIAGIPFEVSSGYRCEKHNLEVGSTSTNHTIGRAADIRCSSGVKRFNVVKAMIGAGMLGLGIGQNYIHCDTNRTTPAIWTY